jgi:uncharacterized oligopeptide transporter (OPT) family protein
MDKDALSRLLGGTPGSVGIRLLIISIVVGALLYWSGLTPFALIRGFGDMIESLVGSGWDAVRRIGEFAAYGAVIVVPIWLIARLFSSRKKNP